MLRINNELVAVAPGDGERPYEKCIRLIRESNRPLSMTFRRQLPALNPYSTPSSEKKEGIWNVIWPRVLATIGFAWGITFFPVAIMINDSGEVLWVRGQVVQMCARGGRMLSHPTLVSHSLMPRRIFDRSAKKLSNVTPLPP